MSTRGEKSQIRRTVEARMFSWTLTSPALSLLAGLCAAGLARAVKAAALDVGVGAELAGARRRRLLAALRKTDADPEADGDGSHCEAGDGQLDDAAAAAAAVVERLDGGRAVRVEALHVVDLD